MVGEQDPSIPEFDLDLDTLPSSIPPPATPIARLGRYDILGRMAIGGMAEIYLATERAGEATRHVVIKLVKRALADDPKFVSMFMSEARVAMRLTHPNICHLYEFGEVGKTYFLAMEYVEGMPLTRLVKRLGALPPALASIVCLRVAEALEYAHNAKDSSGRPLSIVHRDVSPHRSGTGSVDCAPARDLLGRLLRDLVQLGLERLRRQRLQRLRERPAGQLELWLVREPVLLGERE
jgi:serine/threonine protein kinase